VSNLQLQDYLNQVRLLINDTNQANFSDYTLISCINQARTRVAMDTHCVRGFLSVTGDSALNTIADQENYSYDGTVGGITVSAGGSGYTSAPTVTFTGGGGTGAAATATLTDDAVTAVNMTSWGQNYSSAPTIGFTGGAGTGATASAQALTNILDILSITVLWGDLRVIFKWCPFTMFQTYFRQLTLQTGAPSVFTIHQGIKQVFLSQIPDQAYTMEWDIITLPAPLVSVSDYDSQVTAPCTDAVQLYAAHLAIASMQNYGQADYWYTGRPEQPGKYDRRIIQLAATGYCRRIPNPYRTYLKRLRRM
jgi:hypothetical protein